MRLLLVLQSIEWLPLVLDLVISCWFLQAPFKVWWIVVTEVISPPTGLTQLYSTSPQTENHHPPVSSSLSPGHGLTRTFKLNLHPPAQLWTTTWKGLTKQIRFTLPGPVGRPAQIPFLSDIIREKVFLTMFYQSLDVGGLISNSWLSC